MISDKNTLTGKVTDSDKGKRALSISIFIALLVHVAGGIGIAYFNRSFFVAMTPVNLLLMFVLLAWNEISINKQWLIFLAAAFFTGFVTEIIGVNTGWLFGQYAYGSLLGPKILGVPLLIGINWFCIVYCSLQLVLNSIPALKTTWVGASLFAAFFATLFDWMMEPVAMVLGYWQWENGVVPLYNYVCWFLISLLLSMIYFRISLFQKNAFAIPLLVIQFLFFLLLRILIA
jgi:putative membrane protein